MGPPPVLMMLSEAGGTMAPITLPQEFRGQILGPLGNRLRTGVRDIQNESIFWEEKN